MSTAPSGAARSRDLQTSEEPLLLVSGVEKSYRHDLWPGRIRTHVVRGVDLALAHDTLDVTPAVPGIALLDARFRPSPRDQQCSATRTPHGGRCRRAA